jgi:hypothetical protein
MCAHSECSGFFVVSVGVVGFLAAESLGAAGRVVAGAVTPPAAVGIGTSAAALAGPVGLPGPAEGTPGPLLTLG